MPQPLSAPPPAAARQARPPSSPSGRQAVHALARGMAGGLVGLVLDVLRPGRLATDAPTEAPTDAPTDRPPRP